MASVSRPISSPSTDLLPAAVVCRANVARRGAFQLQLDVKSLLVAHHLLVRRAPKGAEQHWVVDSLQQVGLTLGVDTKDHGASGRRDPLEVRQVPVTSCNQPMQMHYSTKIRREAMLPWLPCPSTP
jgi:hypothetical protein